MVDLAKPLPSGNDPDAIERAWSIEIRRRIEKLKAGEAELVDGDEALARVRALVDPYRE